jgi:hypothetical protein
MSKVCNFRTDSKGFAALTHSNTLLMKLRIVSGVEILAFQFLTE